MAIDTALGDGVDVQLITRGAKHEYRLEAASPNLYVHSTVRELSPTCFDRPELLTTLQKLAVEI
jgi:hypothetical protein